MTAKITCDGIDITEHVAAMFDALVQSLDWGSGFLDADEIESILIVAELCGFDIPALPVELDLPGLVLPPAPKYPDDVGIPAGGWPSDHPEVWQEAQRKLAEYRQAESAAYRERHRLTAAALVAWRAQVQAKARAMRADVVDPSGTINDNRDPAGSEEPCPNCNGTT